MPSHAGALTSEPNLSIRDALIRISQGRVGSLVVVDRDGRLRGLVTDGDIRRALLQGMYIEEPLERILNTSPLCLPVASTIDQRRMLLKERRLRHLLIVDEDRRFVELVLSDEVERAGIAQCPVVIMAGGRGERLRPLTDDCPKPMLNVGGMPILERILRRFVVLGFKVFFLSVNYRKEKIIDYFGDGRKLNANITYLHEAEPMGTAGSLTLLPELNAETYLVTNGDLITDMDYGLFHRYHEDQQSAATMAVRKIQHTLNFGMVKVDGTELIGIDEKPTLSFHINAGAYLLSRKAVTAIPRGEYFDMPDLFRHLRASNTACSIYEVHGDWIDVGTPEKLREADERLSSKQA